MKLLPILAILVFANAILAINPIPGWEYMFAGYDIRNASSMATTLDGIKYPIFTPTYAMHQTYQKPNTAIVFDVPDQMYAYPIYETSVITSTDIYQDVTTMLKEESTSMNFGIGYKVANSWGISAGINRTVGSIHYIFNEKDKFAAKGHLDSKTTKFVIGPYQLFTLNPFFDQLVNTRIPQCPKSAADLASVAMLVKIWGHVFPTEMFMGGRFDCLTALDTNIIKKYSKSWVTTQLTLSFTWNAFSLYAGGFSNRTQIKTDDIFNQAAHTSLFFEGGERSLQSNTTLVPWFVSIDDYPGLISASFDPISELATDPVKQRNLLYMLTQHIDTGAITAPPCATLHQTLSSPDPLPPIPGVDFIGAGYDSLTMMPKGFVIDHTYSGNSWTNPFYPTYSYAVPDTAYVWPQTDNFESNFTSIAMSDSEFLVQLKSQVSGSGFLGFGKHSSQMSVYQFYHELHNYDQTLNSRSITWYDLELSPIVEVDPMDHLTMWAKQMFTNLGTDLNNPTVKAQYFRALDAYGDSFIKRVSMGGNFRYQAFLNNDTVNEITIEKFHEQSGWSFLGIFGSHKSWDYYNKAVSTQVKANTVVNVDINGGEWNPGAYKFLKKTPTGSYSFALKDADEPVLQWDDFVTTIKDNMVPVHYEIVPMYTIFSNPIIAANFKAATQEYLQARQWRKANPNPNAK